MLNQSQSFAIKIIVVCILVLAFGLLVGCASNPPPQSTTPQIKGEDRQSILCLNDGNGCLPAGAPRDGCPDDYVALANLRGVACWPRNELNPPSSHCRPERHAIGYMLWNCSVPIPARDAQDNLELEEAISDDDDNSEADKASANTPDNAALRQAVQIRCKQRVNAFSMRPTPLGYEGVRLCLWDLRALVNEDDRQRIDQMLRKYDEWAISLGYTPIPFR